MSTIATFKTATDFRKSLEGRLQRLAAKTGEDLHRLRRKVAFDRFLARIYSQENPGFYLKGGYAMELRIAHARATKDIDLTCTRRVKDETKLLNDLILTDLQSLAQVDLRDHFVYQVAKAQIDLENAILYVLRTGCSWRHLPHDLPPWKSVYSQFLRWCRSGLFEELNRELVKRARLRCGRNAEPTGAIADSQSVKTTEKGASKDLTGERKSKEENVIYWLIQED